jgi:hypothetical protein
MRDQALEGDFPAGCLKFPLPPLSKGGKHSQGKIMPAFSTRLSALQQRLLTSEGLLFLHPAV